MSSSCAGWPRRGWGGGCRASSRIHLTTSAPSTSEAASRGSACRALLYRARAGSARLRNHDIHARSLPGMPNQFELRGSSSSAAFAFHPPEILSTKPAILSGHSRGAICTSDAALGHFLSSSCKLARIPRCPRRSPMLIGVPAETAPGETRVAVMRRRPRNSVHRVHRARPVRRRGGRHSVTVCGLPGRRCRDHRRQRRLRRRHRAPGARA